MGVQDEKKKEETKRSKINTSPWWRRCTPPLLAFLSNSMVFSLQTLFFQSGIDPTHQICRSLVTVAKKKAYDSIFATDPGWLSVKAHPFFMAVKEKRIFFAPFAIDLYSSGLKVGASINS